jgi:DNA-binding IclR family transcriptional regulator
MMSLEPLANAPSDAQSGTELGEASGVTRVVRVLESVAGAPEGVGVRALARATGIDKSAVSRLLRQLAVLTLVEVDASQRYVVGPRLFALAKLITAHDDLTRASRPFLESLVAEFNETSYLAVLEGRQVVYRDVVECTQPVRYMVALDQGSPLHAGAAGRAILAALPVREAISLLANGRLRRLTPNTVTDRARLRELLREDKKRGYSWSVGERVSAGAAVAAPFLGADGTCQGSLVVAFPRDRLQIVDVEKIGQAVAVAAGNLSQRLGHSPQLNASAARTLRRRLAGRRPESADNL